MSTKTRPPSQTSVTATLRAAGFKPAGRRQQGADMIRTPGFVVGPWIDGFRVDWGVGSGVSAEAEREQRAAKLEEMAASFRAKGWAAAIVDHALPYVAVYSSPEQS